MFRTIAAMAAGTVTDVEKLHSCGEAQFPFDRAAYPLHNAAPMIARAASPKLCVARLSLPDDRLADLQRLRFRAYCLEREFLNPIGFPDGLERDEYDEVAHHFGAWDDGELIATVRLVPDSPLGFPMEQFASPRMLERAGIVRHRTAELSRLVLAPENRRLGIAARASVLFRLFEHVFLESLNLGIGLAIAALEPSLQRRLHRIGFALSQIGPPMEWFGTVVPCAVTTLPAEFLAAAAVDLRPAESVLQTA